MRNQTNQTIVAAALAAAHLPLSVAGDAKGSCHLRGHGVFAGAAERVSRNPHLCNSHVEPKQVLRTVLTEGISTDLELCNTLRDLPQN
eukprot:4375308-Alexandrium_andersonii.AAC.1